MGISSSMISHSLTRVFFSTGKAEAAKLDLQQQLLLEVIWECMENGGQTGWQGKNIGCYVGAFGEDWLELRIKDTQDIDRFYTVGAGDYAISNRVSYEYDLGGPSNVGQSEGASGITSITDFSFTILKASEAL